MNKPLVSVMIPAYNNPDYTRKTLQSVVEQEYRPIEVVFCDDCSPTPLEPIVEEFRCFEDNLFSIRFYRQESNLRAGNTIFGFDQSTGKYFINMPHDDWFTDKRFLVEAIEIMENNPECYLCVANSEIEKTNGAVMINNLPSNIDAKDKWCILGGDTYINLLGTDKIPAWSGIVFNLQVARTIGAMHYPFNITESLCRDLDVMPDEGFAFQFLLSSIGSVAITEKVVSVRGMPEDSFSKNPEWAKVVGQALFILYYNLYKAELPGKYAKAVRKRAKETIFHYPVERINLKILRHYDYSLEAIILMFLSYILGRCKAMARFYYISIFWRTIIMVRNGEFSEFKKKLSIARKRGLLHIIFPFR
jgi:glycosyltransferase involved in cell wall biosynthesis